MVHPVLAVKVTPSFGQGIDFSRQGKYSAAPKTSSVSYREEHTGRAGKFIGGIIAAVVVAAGAIFGLYKGKVLKVNPEAKGFSKVTHWLASAGEWMNNKIYEPLARLCTKSSSK